MIRRKEIHVGGKPIIVETGKIARQADGAVTVRCGDTVVLVTARLPEETLFEELVERSAEWADVGLFTVEGVGDAHSPGTIAAAVWDGRRYAEELDAEDPGDDVPFLREIVRLAPNP